VRRCMEESLAVLSSLGARVIELTVPDPARLFQLSNAVTVAEAAAIHGKWMRERPQDYSLYVRSRIEPGFHIPATTYLEALSSRARYLDEFLATVFSRVDVIHTPVMVIPPPTIAETEPRDPGAVAEVVGRITRNTRPASYLGLPALAVPAGFTPLGLPVALQLIGRPFDEATLFRVAHQYQRETDWHTRLPQV